MNPRRLIICTNSASGGPGAATAAERNAITRHLDGKGWQVWHWFQDVWLVVIPPGESPSKLADLGDELQSLMKDGKRSILLLDADGDLEHAGRGPRDGWPWILRNWDRTRDAAGFATAGPTAEATASGV